jgi:uncharacterized membrane protein required for colicin V production
MADGVVAVFLFYGLVFGIRRGFYKELIAFGALLLGALVARALRGAIGTALATKLGVPVIFAEVVAVAAIFIVVALIVNVIGRVLLNRLKNPDGESVVEEGADEIADAIADKGKKGPMTLLTDPIAKATSGAFYWTDKLLGAALGLVKSAVAVAFIFALVVYWSQWTGSKTAFAQSIEDSWSHKAFHEAVEPRLRQTEEYRFLANLEAANDIARVVKADPKKLDSVKTHPSAAPIANSPRTQALAQDAAVQKACAHGDIAGLLENPKVREALADPEFRKAIADADLEKVLDDLAPLPGMAAPPPAPKDGDAGGEKK